MNVAELTLMMSPSGVMPLWWRATPGAEFSPGPVSELAKCLSSIVPLSKHRNLLCPARKTLTHKLYQYLSTNSS